MANKELTLIYDSYTIPTMKDIEEECECMGIDVPKENSEEYWRVVDTLRENESEWFNEILHNNYTQDYFCIEGTLGLWHGKYAVKGSNVYEGLESAVDACIGRDIDAIKVWFNPNDGSVEMDAMHHDGTNHFKIRRCRVSRRKSDWELVRKYCVRMDFDTLVLL